MIFLLKPYPFVVVVDTFNLFSFFPSYTFFPGHQLGIDEKEKKRLSKESKTSADRKRALQLQGGLTPLHVAAMKGHTDFCRSVVQEGKQVNV